MAFLQLSTGTVLADTPAIVPPAPPLKKVFVWVVGKDPANIRQLELDILEDLANHEVGGVPFSDVFPQGLPPSPAEAIVRMQSTGCGWLLVVRKRSTIQWESSSPNPAQSSLTAFLSHSSRAIKSKNQVEAAAEVPIDVANTYGNTELQIVKGEGIVFDLATEKMLWRGETQVKTAADLPLAQYYQRVADKVDAELTAAGLLPPGKKAKSLLP